MAIAVSGMPTPFGSTILDTPAAQAARKSVLRITNSGPGTRRTVKLGLNKALVVDLPADAHDILVADRAWPMP